MKKKCSQEIKIFCRLERRQAVDWSFRVLTSKTGTLILLSFCQHFPVWVRTINKVQYCVDFSFEDSYIGCKRWTNVETWCWRNWEPDLFGSPVLTVRSVAYMWILANVSCLSCPHLHTPLYWHWLDFISFMSVSLENDYGLLL